MYYNGNLGGQTSLLKPYIKHMFQLLDATAAAAGGGGDGGLPPACCLLTAACRCCLAAASASFCHEKMHFPDRKIPWYRLKNGIMRCNNNLGDLTSLLKPCIKHMFQLLDATAAAGGGDDNGDLVCFLPAACSLLPAVFLIFLLLLHPFAMKKTHLPDRKISWR